MKDGRCPMCKSGEVYANPKATFSAGPNLVDVDAEGPFTAYVCVSCGFTAMYFESMDDAGALRSTKRWRKVQG